MTGPLINRDDLEDAIYLAYDLRVNTADAVIAYLREVLTPEALDADDPDLYLTGTDLHRRIFGEDQ